MLKFCSKCSMEKLIELFSIRSHATGKRNTWCKSCIKKYDKERHKRLHAKIIVQKVARREEIKHWYRNLKVNLECEKCPENHPACLTFHHVHPIDKEITISQAVSWCWSKKRILKEMEKCIVLCSNCHLKFHSKERSSR